MSDRISLFKNISELDTGETRKRISRVTLLVDSDNVFTAGDDSGLELSVSCPWGSQAMTHDILARVRNYDYTPFTASGALIDPAAEIGDGIAVSNVYSELSQMSVDLGVGCVAEISAPGVDEIDDEYPYESSANREVNRQLARAYSIIKKTSEEISLEVGNLNEDVTELKVTLDGVTVTDSTGTTKIRGSSIETDTLYVRAANISGKLTADQINLYGAISWSDLSDSVQNDINDAYSMAEAAQSDAQDAADQISAWKYPGSTYIDGSSIMTGTVSASTLEGGEVNLLNGSGRTVGTLTMTGASSSSFAIDLTSGGSLRFTASSGNLYLDNGVSTAFLEYDGPRGFVSQNFMPSDNDRWYLGDYNRRFSGVYLTSGLVTTSDKNLKHDIEPLPEKYLDLLYLLSPSVYKMNAGTSDRLHAGFIAQDVEVAMAECGISSQEFGGLVIGGLGGDSPVYMLRYEEFIPLAVKAIQDLNKRVKELESAK